jgi:hypothetical protein
MFNPPNNKRKMKEEYVSPEVRVIECQVEAGFALSNGMSVNPDEDGYPT